MLIILGLSFGLFMIALLIPRERQRAKKATTGLALLGAAILVAYSLFLGWSDVKEKLLIEKNEAAATVENKETIPPGTAVPDANIRVERADGGSITTQLGYGFAVAKGSSLNREWIVVHNSASPVSLIGVPGVRTVYKSERYNGSYEYSASFKIDAKKSVVAYQVIFILFDVWGAHTETLRFSEVTDVPLGTEKTVKGAWRVGSENDVEEYYASIAYVARARLSDGTIWVAPTDAVLAEAAKFTKKFDAESIESDS